MSIEIEKEIEYLFNFDADSLIHQVVEGCLDYAKCPYEVKVEVTLTNNYEIKRINKEFREIDTETDVLSFPMVEYELAGDFDFLEEDNPITLNCFDPDTGELVLGDIIISVEKAESQANEYGHSLKRELGFLIAHSMFHLFGYDHIEEEERIIMERKQEEVLEILGITR